MMYALTQKGLKPITQKPTLPIGCRVFTFGCGMSKTEGAVISVPDEQGMQRCVSVSDFEFRFFTISRHSQPLSKKFGIGTYYSDSFEMVETTEMLTAIQRATVADEQRKEAHRFKKEANAKELQELPAIFPHLTPLAKGGTCIKNLRADLKKAFPDVKFSVRYEHYGCININWTGNPSRDEVVKISGKYEDHETDFTGDFRDYNPSNFNKIFGGEKYIFEYQNAEPVPVI